jgi:prephenate dehydratase
MKNVLYALLAIVIAASVNGCAPAPHCARPMEQVAQAAHGPAIVSYLGPEGTYTQEACVRFFDKRGTYLPFATVNEAIEALVSGKSNYAVIPQENTIGGAVIDYVDALIATSGVSVVGEVELPIRQNLLALPGTSLGNIRKVYSHKQGIAQSRGWLNGHLPSAEVIEVSSTAAGAKKVSDGGDPSCAAIASAACADVYALDILAMGIQNNDRNKTRFYVLSRETPSISRSARIAFIAKGKAEHLPALMAEMKKQQMTLVAIHDRPMKTELGEYHFLTECSNASYERYKKLTEKSRFSFRYLGSFNVR